MGIWSIQWYLRPMASHGSMVRKNSLHFPTQILGSKILELKMRKKLSEWSASEKNNTCFVFNQFPETKSQSPEKIGMVGRWFFYPFLGFGLPFQWNKHLLDSQVQVDLRREVVFSWIAGSRTWSWFPLTKKLGEKFEAKSLSGWWQLKYFLF